MPIGFLYSELNVHKEHLVGTIKVNVFFSNVPSECLVKIASGIYSKYYETFLRNEGYILSPFHSTDKMSRWDMVFDYDANSIIITLII